MSEHEHTTPAAADAEPVTMTVEEAAAAIGISRASTYNGIKRGEIPSLRIGRRVVIPRARFNAWLAEAKR
jgi:excisionase family DNA binding protein